ncbi:MAG TPA: Flp pilus assembly protein CpaB [Planctomycetaceae bacterium]|nr:Flp pilus assembly protein CpaB [Planctomycetaceae bacterium]
MKVKSLMLLAVAIGCGLVAMLGVQQVLSSDKSAPEPEMGTVCVAAQEIPAGMLLTDTMIRVEKWHLATIPEGAVRDPKELAERALKVRAFPGDLILEVKLGAKGGGASVAIPKGMRVVTVPVNLTMTHSGLIQPGDHVDVLVTYKTRDDKRGQIEKTKTVLEYIEVFATDRLRDVENGDNVKTEAKNISLLVTPEQGSLLMLAASKGQLQLALRHIEDKEQGSPVVVDDTFFEGAQANYVAPEPEPEPAPVATPTPVVEAPPQTKKWLITIFEKDVKRVEEIEMENQDAPEQPSSAPANPS